MQSRSERTCVFYELQTDIVDDGYTADLAYLDDALKYQLSQSCSKLLVNLLLNHEFKNRRLHTRTQERRFLDQHEDFIFNQHEDFIFKSPLIRCFSEVRHLKKTHTPDTKTNTLSRRHADTKK